MSTELLERNLSGDKPLSTLEIPRSLIPIRNGERFNLYKHRLYGALEYMVAGLDNDNMKYALLFPREFAFRGSTRPWHNLPDTLENISLHGIDKIPPCKVWFAFGDPVYGIAASVPQSEGELGILIISRGRGMECLTDDYESDGVEPIRGSTFKSQHLATIVYSADEAS